MVNKGIVAGWRSDGRALLQFALLLLALSLLFSDAVASMTSIWIGSSAYHHGLLAAPISLWLALRDESETALFPRKDWAGAAVIAGAFGLLLIARASGTDLLGHGAVVVALVGAIISVYGLSLARHWAFPLAFLFFMIPVGEEIVPLLQQFCAMIVAAMLDLSGIETSRDGVLLTTGAGVFEIARSCSGLRFLLASAMFATLVAYLAFGGWRRRLAFIAAALAIALAANWLRAYVIIAVATMTDMRIGVGPEHVVLGWILYISLLALLIFMARANADVPRPALAA